MSARIPWIGLLALVAGYVLAFVVRYGTAVILPGLRADFGANEAALGVLAAAYFWPYALIQPVAGMLADWWGPRRSVALFLAGAAVGTALFALAPILPVALIGRAIGGAGVGIVYVCGISAIGQWFRPERFGTASGIYAATGTLGGLFAARPLAFVVDAIGWRGAFLAIAAILLAAALLAWVGIPETAKAGAGARPINPLAGFGQALRLPNVWLTGAYAFVTLGILSTMQGLWTVPFLIDTYRLDATAAAAVLEAWSIGLLVSIPLWGMLTDRVTHSRKWTIVASIFLQGAFWLVMALAPTIWPRDLLWFAFFFAAFANGCWMPAYAQVRGTSPPAIAGTALGLLNFAFFLGAAIFQQTSGLLLAQFPRTGDSLPVGAYQILFGLFVAALAAAAISVSFSRERATPAG